MAEITWGNVRERERAKGRRGVGKVGRVLDRAGGSRGGRESRWGSKAPLMGCLWESSSLLLFYLEYSWTGCQHGDILVSIGYPVIFFTRDSGLGKPRVRWQWTQFFQKTLPSNKLPGERQASSSHTGSGWEEVFPRKAQTLYWNWNNNSLCNSDFPNFTHSSTAATGKYKGLTKTQIKFLRWTNHPWISEAFCFLFFCVFFFFTRKT